MRVSSFVSNKKIRTFTNTKTEKKSELFLSRVRKSPSNSLEEIIWLFLYFRKGTKIMILSINTESTF